MIVGVAAGISSAGTVTRLQKHPSLGHGFVHMTGVCPAARRAMIAIGIVIVVATAIWMITLIVMALDFSSAYLRQKII